MDNKPVALIPHTYKLGDQQVITMLRPLGAMNFNGMKNKETGVKTIQLVVSDICGPALYANFSLTDAKAFQESFANVVKQIEETE